MDIRIEKTERAIKQAFLELRAHKPLEKLKVKDLCEKAEINKSTFYAHYQDLFDLSQAMEQELFASVMADLPPILADDLSIHADKLTQELFRAFVKNQREVNILFSGSRQGMFVNGIEDALRKRIACAAPDYWADPARGVLLSFCVQGGYYAFQHNSTQVEQERLVELVGRISLAAQKCVAEGAT